MNFLWFIIIIFIFIVVFLIFEYNKFKILKNKVKQSRASIDVFLNQRFDLIPNLVECVKSYSEYEKNLFNSVTELRNKYNQTKEIKDGAKLNTEVNRLMLLQEKYPNLKTNENYIQLQKSLEKMEDELQAARRLYNSDVTMYNNAIEVFPGNLLSKLWNFNKEDLFELEEGKEKINIDI